MIRRNRIHFTRPELLDLGLSMIAIALAFAIAKNTPLTLETLLTGVIASFIAVSLGFALHELAHKFVAHYYGCSAEYKANKGMLLFAILISFTGFIFAAPGAVRIQGAISKKQLGHISAAGPLTNILLALTFLLIPLGTISQYGVHINAWLALFNLIPFGPLDGKKIFSWNKTAYTILAAAALVLLFYVVPIIAS